jgi:hypothetical protein
VLFLSTLGGFFVLAQIRILLSNNPRFSNNAGNKEWGVNKSDREHKRQTTQVMQG